MRTPLSCRLLWKLSAIWMPLAAFVSMLPASPSATEPFGDGDLAGHARMVLSSALAEETGWIQVHAAEALIALGAADTVHQVFAPEPPPGQSESSRVGRWRVLAATSPTVAERNEWIERIGQVFLQPDAPDRLQAVESLAKLHVVVTGKVLENVNVLAASAPDAERPFALWVLCNTGDATALKRLGALLASSDAIARLRSAYALRWLRPEDASVRASLAATLATEPFDSLARPYLLGAALALDVDPSARSAWRAEAVHILSEEDSGAVREMCWALMECLPRSEVTRFVPLLENDAADIRIGGAWGVLHLLGAGYDQMRIENKRMK